jgi:surfeit locus 1 family protein
MSMRIGKYRFKPTLVPTLLVALLLPVLISLGIWQLNRAEEKREILQNQQDNLRKPVIVIEADIPPLAQLPNRRLAVRGKFETHYQILIDNKVERGTAGYEVVTPLRIAGTTRYVLVNRGWIPLGESRAILPQFDTTNEEVRLSGLARFETKDVMGSQTRFDDKWPAVVRWLDIEALRKETGLDLLPFVLLLDEKAEHGFVRNWKFINAPPEKSTSYAVQWFTLALALLIIYIVVNTKKIGKNG